MWSHSGLQYEMHSTAVQHHQNFYTFGCSDDLSSGGGLGGVGLGLRLWLWGWLNSRRGLVHCGMPWDSDDFRYCSLTFGCSDDADLSPVGLVTATGGYS